MFLISMSMIVAMPVSMSMVTLALANAESIFHADRYQKCSETKADTAEQKRI